MKKHYLGRVKFSALIPPVLFFAMGLLATDSFGQNLPKVSVKNEKWEKGGIYEGFTPNQEVLEKRNKTTKHFKNANGTFTAQIGASHYQDANGVWQDLDFSITEKAGKSDFKFSNETNDIKSFFPENSGKSVLMKSKDGINLSWWKSPSLKVTSNGSVVNDYKIASKKASVKGNSIIYNDVYPNISEEFEILDGGMENNTIISSLHPSFANLPSSSMMEFSQIIELKKGWQVNANGKVQSGKFESKNFYISIPGQKDVLNFSPIVVFDNDMSKNVVLSLMNSPQEKLTAEQKLSIEEHIFQCNYVAEITNEGLKITTKLPVSWLKNSKRAFPVTIDPTVTIGATTPGNFYGPITHWYGFQRHADLYLQSEIGVYGAITAIEYYKTGTQAARTKPTKVFMRSTTASTLTGADAWNSATYTGGLTALYDGNTTQDATSGWKMITLTSAFAYSSGNLIVMVYDEFGGSGSAQYFAQPVVNARQAYNRVDTTNPGDGATTAVENVLPSLRITYSSNAPSITSFTPDSGCSSTGTVTITGTGFSGTSAVTIGGTAVASFTVNSDTQITATLGTGTTGPIVVTNMTGSSTSTTNFTVNASPAISANAGGATTACLGVATPAFTNTASGGTWSIVPGTGTATISATGVVTGTAVGTVTVVYSVSNAQCTITSTSPLTVNALPAAISVTASSAICSGDVKQLDVTGSQLNVIATIGTGTALTGTTEQPTAFCNRWPNYWSQTIYTAAELTAAGYGPGIINSMAYNVTSLGSAATNPAFTVKIGTTSLSSFANTTYLATTSFTTVYGPTTYTHTATGWQEIVFTTPFVWDGVSNIVINVTQNGADSLYNTETYYSTVANSTIWSYSYTAATTTGNLSGNRLNVRFTGTKIIPVTWTPTTGLFTNAAATVAYTGTATPTIYAKPTATTQYVATATNNAGCTATATSEITVNVTALPTAVSPQNYTTGQTLADLTVSGTGLIWYSDAAGTTVIPSTTVMVSGTTYYVTQTLNGCESDTRAIEVQEPLSSPDFNNAGFKAYPNPVKNFLNLSSSKDISAVAIFNLLGQQVLFSKVNATEGKVDMSSLSQGTYLAKITIDNQVKTIKIVKE